MATDVPKHEFGPDLAHLSDHYAAPITNRQLARLAHMSVRSFERKFQLAGSIAILMGVSRGSSPDRNPFMFATIE